MSPPFRSLLASRSSALAPRPAARAPVRRRAHAFAWAWLGLCCLAAAAQGDAPGTPRPARDPLPGRLFHSAAERAALDRADAPVAPAAPPRKPAVAPLRPPEQSPSLSGFVLRSDGQDSFWLSAPAATPLRR